MLKQLSLNDFGMDSCSITESVSDTDSCSITESVSEPKTKSLLRFLNSGRENTRGGVGIYQPGKRKAQYFRFSYRWGKRTKHCHIPGGNIFCSLALERAMQIQDMADRGVSIENILASIDNFK